MKTPIIEGLKQGDYTSYLKGRMYDALYFPTFFPIKNVNSLDGKTLIGEKGSRVAAMVISYNTKAPELSRKEIKVQHFDIPKIAVKRVRDEIDILEQITTRAMQGNDAVIEDYFNDADFVINGVNARQEWFALQALSTTKIQLTATNNPMGIVNETVVDFGMNDTNKKAVAKAWSTANAATMTPIADFKKVVKDGRKLGLTFSKALMHPDAFDLITGCTEFQTAAKSLLVGESTMLGYTGLDTVNKVFKSLRLPEITLIETSVGIENKAGEITQVNPWSDSHILFISDTRQGDMFNAPIAEELEKPIDVIQGKKGNVLVSVKKGFDPVNVTTKGEANAFPSWNQVNSCMNLYIADTTWA